MKRITIEDLAEHVHELEVWTPKESVLLTRDGKPFAIVSDASIYDEEDIGYMSSPEFWRMIAERRRRRPGIPLEEVEARLGLNKKRPVKKRSRTTTKARNA